MWLTEQGSNKTGEWDPHTQQIVECQDAYIPGKLGYGAGSKHTLRFDPDGNIWASGSPLTRLDRKTLKFTRFDEIPDVYDVKEDRAGNIWFTRPDTSRIGMVDWKTLKVSLWTPPTPGCFPRRLDIASDGSVWFGEFNAGKMGRFDPSTGRTVEYPFPHSENTVREFFRDAQGRMGYGSPSNDKVGYFTLTDGAE